MGARNSLRERVGQITRSLGHGVSPLRISRPARSDPTTASKDPAGGDRYPIRSPIREARRRGQRVDPHVIQLIQANKLQGSRGSSSGARSGKESARRGPPVRAVTSPLEMETSGPADERAPPSFDGQSPKPGSPNGARNLVDLG
jgi:hypothetical protein